MQIEIVSDKKGLDLFIRFPWAVYEGNPNWVPPLRMERRKLIDTRKKVCTLCQAQRINRS